MAESEWNQKVIEQFRAGGEVDGMHRDRLVLLTTTGRRSGKPRTAPMMFLRGYAAGGQEGIVVVASANAAEAHPQWYRNLLEAPRVHVEEPDADYDASARVIRGDERADAWQWVLAHAPFFAEHQEKVDRTIPLVQLVRD